MNCIQQTTILDAQEANCPVDVKEEVKQLWKDCELGNDHSYWAWDGIEMGEDYPIIDKYLKGKNILECLIHYGW